jgi:hypothetical protein
MSYEEETKRKPGPIIAAIITAIGGILIVYLQFVVPQKISIRTTQTAEAKLTAVTFVGSSLPGAISNPTFTPSTVTQPVTRIAEARLEGLLTNREGNPISDMSVGILNGPATKTDIDGKFVLNNIPEGDHMIVVRPPSGEGQITVNVFVKGDQANQVNIVYDAATSRLGLLSIVSPVDGGELEIRQDSGIEQGLPAIIHRATIYGRCDGLGQIFENGYDIWLLVSSERDGNFWVQFPVAVIDPHNNIWRANIVLGDAKHPPLNGEMWTIVAMAADPDSGFDRIKSTPRLSLLPPHITSNVVTVIAQIK